MEYDGLFMQLHKGFYQVMKKSIKKSSTFDLTDQEFIILMNVYKISETTDVTASLLASKFDVTLPAIMHRLSVLENKNLIKKITSCSDKRVKSFVVANEEIIMECNKIEELKKEYLNRFFAYLGKDNIENLNIILKKITKFLEEENV